MKRILFFITILLSLSIVSNAQEINRLTEKEKDEGWKLLFNGENLDGWKTFQGGKIKDWKVIDGILYNSGVGSSHGGDIITLKQYENFELYLEWKVDHKSNSGIFYLVQEGNTEKIFETGPEFQLLDDKGWAGKLNDKQYSGANYDMHRPVDAQVKPINEWNTSQIIVEGLKVQHYLNNVKVVEYELWSEEWITLKNKSKWKNKPLYGMYQKGHIGLQDHGGLTQFRNIKIKVL